MSGSDVRIGEVVGLFGLKGQVKVRSLTDFPSRFAVGKVLGTERGRLKIESAHWHKDQVRLALEGVDTIESAERLVGTFLTADGQDRSAMGEGEYLATDLIGLEVLEGEKSIGRIDGVLNTPAHDLLSVSGALIPFVRHFVKSVDIEAGTVTVELIEGMRPGEASE